MSSWGNDMRVYEVVANSILNIDHGANQDGQLLELKDVAKVRPKPACIRDVLLILATCLSWVSSEVGSAESAPSPQARTPPARMLGRPG